MSWNASAWGSSQQWSSGPAKEQWPETTDQWGAPGKGSKGDKGAAEPAWKKAAAGQGNTPKVVPASWSPAAKGDAKGTAKGEAKGAAKGDAKGAAKGKAAGKGGKSSGNGGWSAGGWAADSWTAADSWSSNSAGAAEFIEKAKKLTQEVQGADNQSNTLLNSSKLIMENENATGPSIKASVDSLETFQTKLNELQKTLNADSSAARKAGPAAGASATELTQLLAKVRGLWQNVTTRVNTLKPRAAKIQQTAELKAKETKDNAAFKPLLAKVNAEVVGAMKGFNAVVNQAAPLVSSPPEEGEARDTQFSSIETAATEASKKLETLKKDINDHLKSIQTYAPESKKSAQTALDEISKKVMYAVKACNVYKHFKKEFAKLVENQKTLDEVTEKLTGHESAISQATNEAKGASVTKEKVEAIDGHLDPVLKAIAQANGIMNKQLSKVDSATMDKVAKLRAQGDGLRKKVEAVTAKIKDKRDVIKAEEAAPAATELLEKAEAAWAACMEAEMPFLMGVEVLPTEENETALKDCREAADATSKAVSTARSFVRSRLTDCKGYETALGEKTTAALNPIMKKIEDVDAKYRKFTKELNERRVVPLLAAAVEAVKEATSKAQTAAGVGKALEAKDLEDQSLEAINALIAKTKTSLGEAKASVSNAKNVFQAKQKESKAQNTHPSVVNMTDGLSKAQEMLHRIGTSMEKALQLVKTQGAIATGEEKVKEAEAMAEKAKGLVPAEDKPFTMETVTAVDEACASAGKMKHAADNIIQAGLKHSPPKAKAALQKLNERRAAVQVAIDGVRKAIKDRREVALSDHYLAEGEVKTKATEDAIKKAEDAEQPFLIGTSLDLKATQELLGKCSLVAKEINASLMAAKDYNNKTTKSTSQFSAAGAKKVKDGFAEMAKRCAKVGTTLATFEKETRDRVKEARMTEATEKVEELEALVKKTVAAAEPFTKEGADTMSEADAEAPLKVFIEANDEYFKMNKEARIFLESRQKEQKDKKDNLEILKKLTERVAKAKEEVVEIKKATGPHEKRALAKRLLVEAKEQVAGLDAEVQKVAAACAPLLEHGGEEYLVSNSINTLISALRAHMKEKDLTDDALFKEIAKGKAVSEKAFVKYLAGLPEAISHDELSAFSDNRRQAIFKRVSSNGKAVSQEDFAGMFSQKFYCQKPIVITDKFEVKGSETVCKVEQNAELILIGHWKIDESGLSRSECTMGDKKGWVTVRQGKNIFLRFLVPFRSACNGMEKAIWDGEEAVQKVLRGIQSKMKAGGETEEVALKEARAELAKMKDEVSKSQKSINELKSKLKDARNAFGEKEHSEKNAHIEARNQREAAPFLEDVIAKIEALEADAKAVDEAAAPMSKISNDELKEFATPASVLEAVDKLAAAVKAKADAAREVVKVQTKAAADAKPQTDGTAYAQKQLKAMSTKLETLARIASRASGTLNNRCKNLISAKLEPAADAIRKRAQKEGKSIEDLFDSLKQGDKIPEAAFCKLLTSLDMDEGASLSAELAKLVCRKLEAADGISKDAFMKFVVVYYKVVKNIAFTSELDISKCKTLRKGDEGEIVEILEGPVTDEANGMVRFRAKACSEPHTVGWITLSGSKGTAFLEKTTKP